MLFLQVAELLQETLALQNQNKQRTDRLDNLDSSLASLQAERDALARQLSDANAERTWLDERLSAKSADNRTLSEENKRLKQRLRQRAQHGSADE